MSLLQVGEGPVLRAGYHDFDMVFPKIGDPNKVPEIVGSFL